MAKRKISVHNISWVEEPLYATWEDKEKGKDKEGTVTVSVNKLIVVKESDENGNKNVKERRVVLYFYVKESPFTSDTITIVSVSALAGYVLLTKRK